MTALSSLVTTPGYRRAVLIRRTLAVLLVVCAAVSALAQRAADDPAVLVFTRDVAPGSVLTANDVALRSLPGDIVPNNALRIVNDAENRVVASTAAAGEVVTATRLLGPDLVSALVAARAEEGESSISDSYTLVPIKLAEPAIIPMLHHGDEVSVVTAESHTPTAPSPNVASAPAGGARIIATGGIVVIAGSAATGAPNSPAGPALSGESEAGVLLLLRNEDAAAVAAASLTSPLAVVLTGKMTHQAKM